jgi:hypothetical protein
MLRSFYCGDSTFKFDMLLRRTGCGIKSATMTIERNLILVHTASYQDVEDFQVIARTVHELAPDIEVFIASNNIPSSVTRRHASRRPTLIFSPGKLLSFRPLRGKVYAGSPIPKLEQIARFKAAGLPVPPSAEITPNIVLPESGFGSHIVVKPGFSESSRGQFITLMRREAVRFQPRETFPEDHPGRYGPMFVQRFIDTGPFVNHYRVLTLFGTPLLAFKTSSETPMPSLDSPDDVLATIAVKARRRDGSIARELTWDADVLELACRTYSALREIALQGVDIIREAQSRKLYVLEANPGGNTWIFSKGDMTTRLKTALGVERLIDQFDAFRTAAKMLVERTRTEAE